MLKIGSVHSTEKREFTKEESKEMILIWEKLTKIASERTISVVEAYGKLKESDPEWSLLSKRVGDCIQNWAQKIKRLGGEPRTMWTIAWSEEGLERVWRLDKESYTPKKIQTDKIEY